MKSPAYHLRPNKAVDRLTLVDAIRRMATLVSDLSDYTYYGFGGPYLEDFRLLYEFYPEIKLVSFESSEEVFKRQEFHAPCHSDQLRLEPMEFKSFLARYESNDSKSIFWLDYIGLEYACFDEFMTLLGKVAPRSLIKITLRCEPTDFVGKDESDAAKRKLEFQRQFELLLPRPSDEPPILLADFGRLLQDMIHIASLRVLPSEMPLRFVPLSSFYYKDSVGMFTLTGVVCLKEDERNIRNAFRTWHLKNLNWSAPKAIDLPMLSTKERLHLQKRLPCNVSAGRVLRRELGYLIDENVAVTEAKLKQYAEFHRYFPYFMKAVP